MNSLGIAIDGGRYVRIQSSIGDFPRSIRLRTLQANQDSARLDFCIFRKGKPQVRKSHRLKGLSNRDGVPSELRLQIERRHYALWEARVSQPGGRTEELRIRTGIGLWPLILLILLLSFAGLWFVLNSLGLMGFSSYTESSVANVRSTISVPDTAAAPAEGTVNTLENKKTDIAETNTPAGKTPDVPESTPASENISEPPEVPVSQALVMDVFDEITVYFSPDSSRLSSRARESLAEAAATIPEDAEIEIGGHCAGFGTERGRRALSLARARVTEEYLSNLLPRSVKYEVKGYAYDKPSTREVEQQHLNRRVVIRPAENDS